MNFWRQRWDKLKILKTIKQFDLVAKYFFGRRCWVETGKWRLEWRVSVLCLRVWELGNVMKIGIWECGSGRGGGVTLISKLALLHRICFQNQTKYPGEGWVETRDRVEMVNLKFKYITFFPKTQKLLTFNYFTFSSYTRLRYSLFWVDVRMRSNEMFFYIT